MISLHICFDWCITSRLLLFFVSFLSFIGCNFLDVNASHSKDLKTSGLISDIHFPSSISNMLRFWIDNFLKNVMLCGRHVVSKEHKVYSNLGPRVLLTCNPACYNRHIIYKHKWNKIYVYVPFENIVEEY